MTKLTRNLFGGGGLFDRGGGVAVFLTVVVGIAVAAVSVVFAGDDSAVAV